MMLEARMAAWKWISGKGFHDRLEGSRISGFFCFLLQEINKKDFVQDLKRILSTSYFISTNAVAPASRRHRVLRGQWSDDVGV